MELALLAMIISPLLGSAVNGLVTKRSSVRFAGTVGTLAAAVSFCAALSLWMSTLSGSTVAFSLPWFSAGTFTVQWGFTFDALTAVMALVVTGIGTVIHLYSIGYMSEDATPSRYFAYLNLFLFNMLLLITADNLLVLFVGWEGVGLCSYLLIGYWYKDLKNTAAGTKAFLVNRIGDAAFLIGIFLCFATLDSIRFDSMAQMMATSDSTQIDLTLLSFAAFFLFIGATGKSAQIPLFVWLPDAMAGPTPVSALIHAATMVTAGVYLIARLSFLFVVTADVSHMIATIGGMTALFAATIATSQNDIKKILAYSTISQLGFMFLALGVGAYTAAIFHLMTHAFFKALLFLGAGSVIHAMDGEQDICKMGGLRKKLPSTFWTFTFGVAAICGVPLFSGFFSKDAILYLTLSGQRGSTWLWVLGSFSAILTAFYMMRLYLLVFFGKLRSETHHPHESPWLMTLPLWILGIGSIVAGYLEIPHLVHIFPDFLNPIFPEIFKVESFLSEFGAMGIATAGAALGMGTACYFYYPDASRSEGAAKILSGPKLIFTHKYWIDELYDIVWVQPFQRLSKFATWVDTRFIDGLVLLPARLCQIGSTALGFLQFGSIQFYLWIMVVGALAIFWVAVKGVIL